MRWRLAAALAALLLGAPGAPASLFPAGLRGGDFATGTLRGFREDGLHGGAARVVRQGTVFSGLPGSDAIPFPDGPGSYAVLLRSRGDGRPDSVGILTSVPFVPSAPELSFLTLSESDAVRFEVLFLDPDADVLHPAPEAIQQRVGVPIEGAGTGAGARFTPIRLPFPGGTTRPVRVQFRQETLVPTAGYFTLVTRVHAGEGAGAADADGDGRPDALDDCPAAANAGQTNSDGDRYGDACDNCPWIPNPDQADRDENGVGDRCTVDLDGDGYVDAADVARLAATFGAEQRGADLDGSGRVGLADLALFARQLRFGLGSDRLRDFSDTFVDHSVNGGMALAVPRGMVIALTPGSDLIPYPGPFALTVRSNEVGDPRSEGVIASRPFVPSGPRLRLSLLSESPQVEARLRLLRPAPDPRVPAHVLLDLPLPSDAAGSGPDARFVTHEIDLAPWFDAAAPLRSTPLQVEIRQHTLRPGAGYFTLVGDVRTGP